MKKRLLLTVISVVYALILCAQQFDSTLDKIAQFPNHLFSKIKNKTSRLDEQLSNQTEKYLKRMARKEAALEQKLNATDSLKAKQLFAGVQDRYIYYEQKLEAVNGTENKIISGQYFPFVDSLKGALSFVQGNQRLLNISPEIQNIAATSLGQFNQLMGKIQVSKEISQFMDQRKHLLENTFTHLTEISGINKFMDNYNRQACYYEQQIRAYEDILNDPDKLLQKALGVLDGLPTFQSFMKNNSMLSGLLNIPSNASPGQAVQGMASREQVISAFQNQMGLSGPSMSSVIQQNVQSAQGDLDQIRNKLSSMGLNGGTIDPPNFVPNNQKTKSFLKRLQLGINFQTQHNTYYYPTTTDIGLSLGYRINNNNIVGIGASYKVGWGTNWNHIAFVSEGAGLRSFIDLKIKGNFFASGGLEYNYQQPFSSFSQIQYLKVWQQSGLIGVTKMVSLRGKLVKNTKLQLLWDFLSYYQNPRTQPIKFRIGYNF